MKPNLLKYRFLGRYVAMIDNHHHAAKAPHRTTPLQCTQPCQYDYT
jgi:hypothetical protein